MKRTVTLPTIKIEHFVSPVLSGEDVHMYHIYVNGDFYRAVKTKDEVISIISIITEVECDSI